MKSTIVLVGSKLSAASMGKVISLKRGDVLVLVDERRLVWLTPAARPFKGRAVAEYVREGDVILR